MTFALATAMTPIIYMMTWACSVLSSPRLTRKRRTWRSMAMSIVTTNVADASGSACRAASTCSSGMTTPTISFTKQPLEIISEIFKNGISTTVTQTNSYNKHNDKIETMTLKVGNVTRTVSSYSYNDISRLLSIKRSGNVLRGYDFAYDGLNRLEESTYAEGAGMSQNKNRYSENVLSYSANGSIERLQRYGKKNNGTFGLIDDLTYSYNGNQIKEISDKAGSLLYDGSFDFKDGANADVEYFYDANGALVKNLNKGISNIEYDVLGNLYGHAYFYELKQKNPSIEPSHTFGVVGYVKEFDPYFNQVVSYPVFGKNNTELEEQINIVEQQAIDNYEKNNR